MNEPKPSDSLRKPPAQNIPRIYLKHYSESKPIKKAVLEGYEHCLLENYFSMHSYFHKTPDTGEDHMSFGQNVKKLRNKYELSLVELADLSNVSFSMLSKIEREEKNPTLNVAVRIARALKTSLSDLAEERTDKNVIIVRKAERKFDLISESGAKGEPISSFFPRSNIEIIAFELPAGASTDPLPPHTEGVKEYLFVENGTIKLLINSEEHQLDEGDYIYYEPSKIHRISNLASGPSAILMIIDRSVLAAK